MFTIEIKKSLNHGADKMRFKIFKGYYLFIDTNTHRIFIISVKSRVEKILKATVRENNSYYSLYQNGNKKEYSLRDLVEKTLNQSIH